jgi:polyisoprenoid-binding protein YceI
MARRSIGGSDDATGIRCTLQAELSNGSLSGRWTLDSTRSSVTLRTKSIWGLVRIKGVFREFEGDGEIATDGSVAGRVSLATASLDTKNNKRDVHLHSNDFFSSDTCPSIAFDLTGMEPSGEGVTLSGTMTVRGQTRPISFPATVTLSGSEKIILDANVEVDRSQFGITWNRMGVASMNNSITIHAVFAKT